LLLFLLFFFFSIAYITCCFSQDWIHPNFRSKTFARCLWIYLHNYEFFHSFFLSACKNREIQERLRLELIFMDSKVAYLKDQLAELNGDWSVFHKKYTRASELLENLCLNAQNDYSLTSSLLSVVEPSQSDHVNHSAYEKTLTSDIMIYLPLKETINKLNFEIGFKQFIQLHFKEDPSNYIDQIKQFNYFREVILIEDK
jgi:hypothetical protein